MGIERSIPKLRRLEPTKNITSILNEALAFYPKPKMFNTDQGSQYTAKAHMNILKKNTIKISMDGKCRATDNICIERFWRIIKYEEIYLNEYKNIKILNRAIEKFIIKSKII